MKLDEKDYLAHYGILRKSGRYPWGSGGTQSKRNKMFLDVIQQHRSEGMSDLEIAKGYGISLKDLRDLKTIARNEQKQQQINMAVRLQEKGMSNVAIGERMGLNESTVRSLLSDSKKDKLNKLEATSDMLRREVEEKGAIDIGTEVFRSISLSENAGAQIGVSSTQFDAAVTKLREEGYEVHKVKVPQIGAPGNLTTIRVLAKPDVKWVDLKNDPGLIKSIDSKSDDGGRTFDGGFQPPIHVSSKRLQVVYGNEGGNKADGLIYVRPNVKDLSLGGKNYAQVRVGIDGTHYLKGMAVYKDDLPAGVDLAFHTNKGNTGKKTDALKEINKDDPDLPFGAVVRQLKDEHGKVKSALNIVNEEGDWDTWSKNLPAQMLSKQHRDLIIQQLDLTHERRVKEFDELSSLTNPLVKKRLLTSFAESTDSAGVHLKAASMKGQATKVLIPLKSIKENEVFAPSIRDGTRVALVRFPHGGPFEIPVVRVNNKNREARQIIGSMAPDAIGIHHKVAERLSGADFDGDFVLAIPDNSGKIRTAPPLAGLKDFDPKASYKAYDGMRTVDGGTFNEKTGKVTYPKDANGREKKNPARMQQLMGDVSNLVTDMTLRGAGSDELARAVRHSMVIIDSEKHHLDHKSSARDNGIKSLKEKYQGIPTGSKSPSRAGASTLISRASSPVRVPAFKPRPASEGGPIDRTTGKKVFVPTNETFVNKKGETVVKTRELQKLAATDDAHTLSSGLPVETIYGDHSNRLKALANKARKEAVHTPSIKRSPSAASVYANEVASLESKLNVALKNAPLERQAQALANSMLAQKRAANPSLTKSDEKKIKNQALAESRARVGAKKHRIGSKETPLTPREWEAIQAGAISNHKLDKILQNSELDTIRQYATPKAKLLMTSAKTARAQAMLAQGYTQIEVADALGVSLTTLKTNLSGE